MTNEKNKIVTPGECPIKSKNSDAENIAISKLYLKPPFSVVFNIPEHGHKRYVIADANGKLCAGHAFLLRCAEALNAHEQNRTEND